MKQIDNDSPPQCSFKKNNLLPNQLSFTLTTMQKQRPESHLATTNDRQQDILEMIKNQMPENVQKQFWTNYTQHGRDYAYQQLFAFDAEETQQEQISEFSQQLLFQQSFDQPVASSSLQEQKFLPQMSQYFQSTPVQIVSPPLVQIVSPQSIFSTTNSTTMSFSGSEQFSLSQFPQTFLQQQIFGQIPFSPQQQQIPSTINFPPLQD